MALPTYVKTIWIDDQAPATDADHLNHIEEGIYAATNEAILLSNTIAGMTNPNYTAYIPQVTAPVHQEGVLFYDDNSHSFSYYNDIADMTVNISQELIVRVFNNTGVPIPNGTPVRMIGTVNNLPSVAACIADNYTNALIGGVTTHEIADQEEGYVTIMGSVGDIDTSTFAVGDRLYLSESVAGGFVTFPEGDIVSYVGSVLSSGADGKILAKPRSLISLPSVSAYMNTLTAPDITITATATKFVNFTNEAGVVIHGDTANGTFTASQSGLYLVRSSFVVSNISGGNSAQEIWIRARRNESATEEISFPIMVGRNAEEASATPFFEISLATGDTVSLWHDSTSVNEEVTFDAVTFSLTSITIN